MDYDIIETLIKEWNDALQVYGNFENEIDPAFANINLGAVRESAQNVYARILNEAAEQLNIRDSYQEELRQRLNPGHLERLYRKMSSRRTEWVKKRIDSLAERRNEYTARGMSYFEKCKEIDCIKDRCDELLETYALIDHMK